MMLLVQSVVTEVVALAVGGAAICRLAGMHLVRYHGVRHRLSWVAVYLAMLIGAIASVHEVLAGDPSTAALILMLACALYLWQSRHTWHDGPPAFIEVREDGKP